MEKKIALQLGADYSINDLSSAVITCLTGEYLVDDLRDTLRSYNIDNDMKEIVADFDNCVKDNYDVSFSNITAWISRKTQVFTRFLQIINRLDEFLAKKKVITKGQLVAEKQVKLNEFMLSLAVIRINTDSIDFGTLEIKEDYVDSLLEQLSLIDQGILLSQLTTMQITVSALDKDFKNSIIDKKLKKLNAIVDNVEQSFELDADRLIELILKMNDQLYNISYDNLTDAEKKEKSVKVINQLSTHLQVLDKLENKLEQGNELKRQLKIHITRLQENYAKEEDLFKSDIENPEKRRDQVELRMNSIDYYTDNYIKLIESAVERINNIEIRIAKQYDVLDQIKASLSGAIPTEDDMSKYSQVGFKLNDLSVRATMQKSQVDKRDRKLCAYIDNVSLGLKSLEAFSKDIKDLYMRNCMSGALFGSVNAIMKFAESNNLMELTRVKDINTKLLNYSKKEQEFEKVATSYTDIANNLIRDVSIIMGKTFTIDNMKEINDVIDGANDNFTKVYEKLKENHLAQIELLNSLMNM